jgi:CheY-like chemotaxis protein
LVAPIRTLLVVDDDNEFRENLSNILTAEGYAVLNAANGARAFDALKHVPSRCLIISDLDMPEMTGEDFAVKLQDLEQAGSRFPVIILSGADVRAAWRLPGVVRVLTKPLNLVELKAAVSEECNAFGAVPDAPAPAPETAR